MLVPMGSTALAAAVVLHRYGGLNYSYGTNEDSKRQNVTLHNFVQCVQILNKSASFTTKCIMVTKTGTDNICLTPALIDDVTE